MSTFAKKIVKGISLLRKPRVLARKLLYYLPDGFAKQRIMHFPDDEALRRELKHLETNAKDGVVFVFPAPSCPWGYMFQRPQQLARALAKLGFTVIYMVDTSYPYAPDWFVRGLKRLDSMPLYLYNDGRGGEGLRELETALVLWQYWPHQSEAVDRLVGQAGDRVYRIYDCIDDLSTFIPYPGLEADYNHSIEQADAVLATASLIFDSLKSLRKDVILVPNGVDIFDFEVSEIPSYDASLELAATEQSDGRLWNIGYYGAIAPWFDFNLIEFLAQRHRNWSFQLVGEIYPEVANRVKVLEVYPNVRWSERVPYAEIPSVLKSFDVAILPFLKNDITLRTSPVKVYEYLAGGKPTVSTDLPEVLRIPYVRTASNYKEFEEGIEDSLKLVNDTKYTKQLRDTAQSNTWQSRVEQVLVRFRTDTTDRMELT